MAKLSAKKKLGMHSGIAEATRQLRELPIPAIVASMELQLDILRERGIEIVDFDNKDKHVEQIRMMGGKVYFLAASSDKGGGENERA